MAVTKVHFFQVQSIITSNELVQSSRPFLIRREWHHVRLESRTFSGACARQIPRKFYYLNECRNDFLQAQKTLEIDTVLSSQPLGFNIELAVLFHVGVNCALTT